MNKPKNIKDNASTLLSEFQRFAKSESMSGVLLILAALVAFIIANSPLGESYFEWINVYFGLSFGEWSLKKPLILWVNDALMALFFLMVGLEIKRELLIGELSRPRDAALSVFAALGGMVVPALIYVGFNYGEETIVGWGIPMATDIAFALGVMALLGKRVPLSLKVFLTALAIVDDLGAVAVIAIFYTEHLQLKALVLSGVLLLAAFGYGRLGGRNLVIYGILGVIAWYFMLKSGVHATVAGVLLAFTVPMDSNKNEHIEHHEDTLHRLEHGLQPWVAYAIMPIFAFFNAGIMLGEDGIGMGPVTLGCALGLLIGKPIGVFTFSWVSVKLGWASWPQGIRAIHIFAVGILAGIGFTMSFFIANLAFKTGITLDAAKMGVLLSSVTAAILGFTFLWWSTREGKQKL